MGFSLRSLSWRKEQNEGAKERTSLYLNVYDLTPVNNYLYWLGLGIFHSGIEGGTYLALEPFSPDLLNLGTISSETVSIICKNAQYFILFSPSIVGIHANLTWNVVHGMEYGFGAHEYPSSGVFEVEPRSCPGFVFRRAIPLGSTDMSRAEFRSFMQHLASKYHGDTYHLIAKNCNHFTDEVCLHLTGRSIPGWVNRLARLGSFFNCLLPENIQIAAVRQCPDHVPGSEDGSESLASSASFDSTEEVDDPDHHLLTTPTSDVAFLQEKPVRISGEMV